MMAVCSYNTSRYDEQCAQDRADAYFLSKKKESECGSEQWL